MDAQDRQDGILSYGILIQPIIGCSCEVMKELGSEFLESVYEKAQELPLDCLSTSAIQNSNTNASQDSNHVYPVHPC